jgi:prolyl-tRNA synthetase
MRGVPLRIEIGPKDVAKGSVALARRDKPGREGKSFVPQEGLGTVVAETLADIHASLYDRALAFRTAHMHDPRNYDEFRQAVDGGWAFSWWCGGSECEAQIKEDTKATTRNIPLEQPGGAGQCIHCGQPAKEKAIFAKAY